MSRLLMDLEANRGLDHGRGRDGLLRTLLTARYGSVLLFRVSQAAGRRSSALGALVKQLNQMLTGADLAPGADVGPGLVLFHPVGVVIGPQVRIGARCLIQQGVTLGGSGVPGPLQHAAPSVGADVLLGAGAKCIGPITIGDRARIGANAVVLIDVPEGRSAVGVPARVLPARSDGAVPSAPAARRESYAQQPVAE